MDELFHYLNGQKKGFWIAVSGEVIALFGHIICLWLFYTFNVTPLFYLNIFSVALYPVLLIFTFKKIFVTFSMVIFLVEVIIHQALAVFFLGWEYGFQFNLFIITGFLILTGFKNIKVNLLFAAINLITIYCLYVISQSLVPAYALPNEFRITLYSINLGILFFMATFAPLMFVLSSRKYEQSLLEAQNALELDIQKRKKYEAALEDALDELETTNVKLIEARDSLWGEMELAKKIQTALLPEMPTIKGYDIAAYIKPSDEVGGDYYDVINLKDRDWFIIGDVSGHGVPAGLIMMMVQTCIHNTLNINPDLSPSMLLTKINNTITRNIQLMGEEKYMTITAFATQKDGQFTFAGLHQDIMVYRNKTGQVELVDTKGMWIGILDDLEGLLPDDQFAMEIGDTMLVYTDGITEATPKRVDTDADTQSPEDDMFGEDRLQNVFNQSAHHSVGEIGDHILKALNGYEFNDDITMMVIKRIPDDIE